VAFVVAEPVAERAWLKREAPDFYTIKHHVAALAGLADIDLLRQPMSTNGAAYFGWQEGQSAAVGDMAQGWTARFGMLKLAMVKSLGVEGKVYAGTFAILPEKLGTGATRRRFSEFSLMPAALRDLALVVDASTPAADAQKALAKAARAAAGNSFAVERVTLFDLYEGKGLPLGKKSLAFSLVFRANDRTLTDDEVNGVFQKIQEDISKSTTFQIRK
jgi:phenylalanyl-tRNA synthetase beta chain